jgi:hypothetical protein
MSIKILATTTSFDLAKGSHSGGIYNSTSVYKIICDDPKTTLNNVHYLLIY